MQSYLEPFASLGRVLPLVLATLSVVGTVLFVLRSRRGSRAQAAWTTALDLGMAVWLGLILLVTVVPFEPSGYAPPIGFIPFLDSIQRVVNGERWPSSEIADIVLNVVVFMPFGVAAALRWGRRWMTRVIVGAAALSLAIEVSQAVEAADRFASTTDIVTNTTGAALGFLIGLRMRGLAASGVRPYHERRSSAAEPTDP